jgi:signal transduction histidine kinase
MAIVACFSSGIILSTVRANFARNWIACAVGQYLLQCTPAAVILLRAMRSLKSSNETLMIVMLIVFFAGNTVLLLALQATFDGDGGITFRQEKISANYLVLAACTIPAVMPARIERERARFAEKVNEFRQSFIRYISHEIRTPLNVSAVGVAIMEDFLQAKHLLVGEVGEIVDQTKQALAISTEILNDMLTFEKLNANAMILEQTLERPVAFIATAAALFAFQARDRGISFQLPVESPNLSNALIFIDTYKMSQVIRNLISNALKFTNAGGTVRVTIDTILKPANVTAAVKMPSIVPDTDWLRVTVEDDGAGIAPENIGKLFTEIIQFDANRLQAGKGSGLGMFISRGIVDLHGGTISVSSEGLGRGCTFTVDLPLLRSHLPLDNIGRDSIEGPDGITSNTKELSSSSLLPAMSRTVVTSPVYSRQTGETFEEEDNFPVCLNALNISPTLTSGFTSGKSGNLFRSHIYAEDERESSENSSSHHSRLSLSCPPGSARKKRNAADFIKDVESGRISLPSDNSNLQASQFTTIDLRDCRVLLVDDSPMNLKMMSLLINKFGAKCIDACNGERAFHVVLESLSGTGDQVDIVIMDHNMDVMSGPDACKLMRGAGFTNPIFGLTGDADERSDQIYLAAGANQIFRKPLKLKEIIDALTLCSL